MTAADIRFAPRLLLLAFLLPCYIIYNANTVKARYISKDIIKET